jgi:Subtilase family
MKLTRPLAALAAATAVASTAGLAGTAAASTASLHQGAAARPASVRAGCPPAGPGKFRCFAVVRTDVHGGLGVRGPAAVAAGHLTAAALPPGYGPAQLRSAYHLPATGGRGQTVAVVDAGNDPRAAADLAIYRSTYGLPPCTTANGCLRIVNQKGATSPLPPDLGWGIEISLDLDMVSAACPHCHIMLVEGNDPTFDSLATAENTAVRLGAKEVSNSYGTDELNGMRPFKAAYSHPGVAIVVSSGDSGYGIPSYPAVFPAAIAVGGTTLTRTHNARGWAEKAWNSDGGAAGSGCSAWIAKPAWQHDPHCPGRMTADIAADADPQTGPAVYDSHDGLGWVLIGGTSASAPFIAGVIALAGHPALFPNASRFYTHAKALHDITAGSNAITTGCGGDYQCRAVRGYDGPTGNGTPNGLGAF